MEHLNFPDEKTWYSRYDWFNNLLEEKQGYGSYIINDHATALSSELMALYCCGAWYSIIILSVSIIDAQLRDTEMPDHKGSTYDLANCIGFNEDFDWLRKKRNKLVHVDLENPAASLDDYYNKANELQEDAKRAIEIVCDAFFFSPGT